MHEKYKQVLELLKTKYSEENNLDENHNWSNWFDTNNISFYFGSKNGDVEGFTVIRYREIEITCLGSNQNKYNIGNIDITLPFNFNQWLIDIEKELNGEVVPENTYQDENTPTQKVEPQVIENNEYKLKAEVLDKLLSKSKVILES